MVPYGKQNAVKLTVNNGALSFSAVEPEQPEIKVESFAPEANLYSNKPYRINLTVTNSGADFLDDLYVAFFDENDEVVANRYCQFEITKGKTETGAIVGELSNVEAGNYTLAVCTLTKDGTLQPIASMSVVINEEPENFVLANEGFTFDGEINCSDFKTTCRVTNTGGLFAGVFWAYVYVRGDDNAFKSVAKFTSDYCLIDKNTTKEISFAGSFDGVPGQVYYIYLFYLDSTWHQVGGGTKFTLTSSSGIDDVVVDAVNGVAVYPNPAADVAYVESGSAMGNIAVYSLSGQKVLAANAAGERRVALEVGNLQSGVYVVKIATEDGEVVSRLIKK